MSATLRAEGGIPAEIADEGGPDVRRLLEERYARRTRASPSLTLYYRVKPLLPRSAQIALRRAYARRLRRRHESGERFPRWPIEPMLVEQRAARIHERVRHANGEPVPVVGAWPAGHRFAFVLTHDVEGPRGLANVERVLEVERRHEMVSAWYLVADEYRIDPAVVAAIEAAGGEIGLHGLRHDGRLFEDRAAFERQLPRIREVLADWGAAGFRSPATHRNPDWMPELGCAYDSSFPDTDPFEPQPGGCCSILPYFLDDLVELPITLVQDHTLFEILREPDIELWRRKAAWIADNGGLVNVLVHPDYVLDPERLDRYDELLGFLAGLEGGWHALPRDVARWWRRRAELVPILEDDGAASAPPDVAVTWIDHHEAGVAAPVPPAPAPAPAARRTGDGPMALVLGSIELLRPLAMARVPCGLVTGPDDGARFSRHAGTVLRWEWSDPGAEAREEELVERLLDYGRAHQEPPILFPYWDEPMLFVSRRRDRLAEAFRFAVADAGLLEALADKARFAELASKLGLPVPPGIVVRSGCMPPAGELEKVGFPLIVKPLRRDRLWEAVEPARKALRVDTPEALEQLGPRLSAYRQELLMQRYIAGAEASVESYHVYVDAEGEIAGEFTGRKIRTLPAEYGHTTALVITDAADVADRGRGLVSALGLRGVAKFDFKRAPDGELHLMEVNPRFNMWHHAGARAGVNLPALVYADLAGRRRPAVGPVQAGLRWCHPKDVLAARRARVPMRRWLPWAATCEAKAFWAWDDPMPLLGAVGMRATRRAQAALSTAHGQR
jgi:D-aspartate ligase